MLSESFHNQYVLTWLGPPWVSPYSLSVKFTVSNHSISGQSNS